MLNFISNLLSASSGSKCNFTNTVDAAYDTCHMLHGNQHIATGAVLHFRSKIVHKALTNTV